MGKQLNLLYFSPTETTAKVVKGVAEGLGGNGKEYDITLPQNRVHDIKFGPNDLLVVGVPVYAGRIPDLTLEYFEKVKGDSTQVVLIAVYGNRDYDDALLELKDLFEQKGFIPVAAGAFIGEHTYTSLVATARPDPADLQKANEFGRRIKLKLNDLQDISQLAKLEVKGNFPYREKKPMSPTAPVTNDDCIDCGICAENCPTAAINFEDYKDIEASKCIKCCSCVKKCPEEAKSFEHEGIKKITQTLIDNFSQVRKEVETFI